MCFNKYYIKYKPHKTGMQKMKVFCIPLFLMHENPVKTIGIKKAMALDIYY